MNLTDYKGIFVCVQQIDNKITGVSFELIGEAKKLAKDLNCEVTAVLLGSKVTSLCDSLAERGADKVIVVD
ncbi:MAG: electron transfer flavoprotein subunit alpha/FixB family protein, partial [Oscillospiraceae bacterium]